MRQLSFSPRPLLVLIALGFSPASIAGPSEVPDTLARPSFTFRGFGTLGAARSSSNQADFVRDLSQPDGSRGHWSGKLDSLLGVQANFRFDERLEAVGQLVSRYGYDRSYRPELSWVFLKFDPNPGLSLRAGRVGMEFYMLADSRLIGYSYLPVRPPTDYFSPLPLYHIDGGDATMTVPLAGGLAKVKAFYGRASEKITIMERTWDFTGSQLFGTYFDFLRGPWQWRVSYAQIRFARDLPGTELRDALRMTGVPSAVDAASRLRVADRRAHYYSAGVVYDDGPFQAQLMLSRTRHESPALEPSVSGYGLLAYRVSSVTPYVGFSRARSESRSLTTGLPDAVPTFAELNAATAALMGQSHVDQRSVFVGARWDVARNVALKVQWDGIRGRSASTAFVQGETPDWGGRTDVLSFTLDFVF